jgi:hypothetical protein
LHDLENNPNIKANPGTTTTIINKNRMVQVTNDLSNDELKDIAIERLKWENRRTITWVFTYAAIVYAFLILFILIAGSKEIAERITASTDLLTWIFMGLLTPVALYFGGTVIDKFAGTKKQ